MKQSKAQQLIINHLEKQGESTPSKLQPVVKIGRAMLHRHLIKLITAGVIVKVGNAPRVSYKLNHSPTSKIEPTTKLSVFDATSYEKAKDYINKQYINIQPDGNLTSGINAFLDWCFAQNLQPFIEMKEYMQLMLQTEASKNEIGLIRFVPASPTPDVKDFLLTEPTTIGKFGESKLQNLIKAAKEQDSLTLYTQIGKQVALIIKNYTIDQNIDAIGFIPNKNKADTMLYKVLAQESNPNLPLVNIEKLQIGDLNQQGSSPVSLLSSSQNAFAIDAAGHEYNNVLLVADEVQTGATVQSIAAKIKQLGIARQVFALGLVGPLN